MQKEFTKFKLNKVKKRKLRLQTKSTAKLFQKVFFSSKRRRGDTHIAKSKDKAIIAKKKRTAKVKFFFNRIHEKSGV